MSKISKKSNLDELHKFMKKFPDKKLAPKKLSQIYHYHKKKKKKLRRTKILSDIQIL